jgi:hypothetical protein
VLTGYGDSTSQPRRKPGVNRHQPAANGKLEDRTGGGPKSKKNYEVSSLAEDLHPELSQASTFTPLRNTTHDRGLGAFLIDYR